MHSSTLFMIIAAASLFLLSTPVSGGLKCIACKGSNKAKTERDGKVLRTYEEPACSNYKDSPTPQKFYVDCDDLWITPGFRWGCYYDKTGKRGSDCYDQNNIFEGEGCIFVDQDLCTCFSDHCNVIPGQENPLGEWEKKMKAAKDKKDEEERKVKEEEDMKIKELEEQRERERRAREQGDQSKAPLTGSSIGLLPFLLFGVNLFLDLLWITGA